MSRLPLSVMIVVATLLVSAPAARAERQSAGAVEEARTRFQAGVQLFHEGSYEAALAEFRKAYQLAPSYRLLYNIAQVELELHDYVEAWRSYRQYLSEGGDEIPAERRSQVTAEIQKLETRVAYIEVITNVDDAEVLIDDVSVGPSPLAAPVMVNAGLRRISATKDGRTATTRNVTVAGGDHVKVTVEVPMVERVPLAGQRTLPLRAAAHEKDYTKAWVGLAFTGALAAGTGVFALLTLQAKKDFEKQIYYTFPTTAEEIEHKRKKLVLYAALADGLGGATLLAGGLTLYFALSHGSDTPEPKAARRTVQISLVPTLVPTMGGMTLLGQF